jgi:hypothetical protein
VHAEDVTDTALYHPYIRPRDEAWLKAAVLAWPLLGRVMPQGYQPADSPGVRLLMQERLMVSVPAHNAASAITQPLATFFGENAADLSHRYGLHNRDNWPVQKDAGELDSDPRLAYVHTDKASWPLIEQLEALGLAERGRSRDWSWLGMHPQMASTYMAALAQQIAKSNQLTPITDQPAAAVGQAGDEQWLASSLLGRPASDTGHPEQTFAVLAVAGLSPRGLSQMNWNRVLALRTELMPEMLRFRAHLASFEHRLALMAATDDADLAREQWRVLREQAVDIPLAELEDVLGRWGLKPKRVWHALCSLGGGYGLVETMQGVGLNTAGPAGTAVVVGAAAVVGAYGWRAQREEALAGSPVSYLYRIQEEVEGRSVIRRISRSTRALNGLMF